MSAIAAPRSRSAPRPSTIIWATILNIVGNLASLGAFVVPGSDQIPAAAIAIGLAIAAVSLVLAWPVWNGKKWAAITLTVITILNTLASLPGLFDPPSGALAALIVGGIAFTAVFCWLLWHPNSRSFYRGA